MQTRRSFLKSASAAVALSTMADSYLLAKPMKSPVRLGVTSYTFRKFTPDQVIGFMHELKTPYLSVKEMHLPMQPLSEVPARAEHYRRAGIKLTGAGVIYFKEDTDAAIQPVFEYLKAAGLKNFTGGPTHETLERVASFCKKYDVTMGIHNHGPEDKQFPSPADVGKAIARLDRHVGWCIDLGHTLRTDTDPVEAIRMAGKRLYGVHMKDLADPHKKESQVAVGEGVMPVEKIFAALIQIGYPGVVDLEYEIKADDPMPGVQKSFAYMRATLKKMGYSA